MQWGMTGGKSTMKMLQSFTGIAEIRDTVAVHFQPTALLMNTVNI